MYPFIPLFELDLSQGDIPMIQYGILVNTVPVYIH